MKIWITKYALSTGILEADADVAEDGKTATVRLTKLCHQCHHGDDFHLTEEDAIARAEVIRKKKLASLEKQMNKIAGLKFGST